MFQHGLRLRDALSLVVVAFAMAACTTGPSGTAATPPLGPGASSAVRSAQSGGSSSSGGGTSTGGGSSSSKVDVIKVGKNSYTAGACELLVSAASSDVTAHLYLYAQSGTYLGEVQNGRGGRYGGNVFVTCTDPVTLTINSTSGGTVTVATVPFVP